MSSLPARLRDPVVVRVAQVLLLAAPLVLAFFSGGFFDAPRLAAATSRGSSWRASRRPACRSPRAGPARAALGRPGGADRLDDCVDRLGAARGPRHARPQRLLLYLAALMIGIAVLRPQRVARAIEPLLAASTFLVIGYGLSGRFLPGIVKLNLTHTSGGRLEQPLTYWNAMGAVAAIGLVLCARLAGDPARRESLRIAAAAACAPLGLGLYMTFSRGGLVALGGGVLVLVLLCPTWTQLRSAAIGLEAAVLAAAPSELFNGFQTTLASHARREKEGLAMLAILLVVTLVAGLVQQWACRDERDERLRMGPLPLPRRAATAIALVTVAAVVGTLALAASKDRPQPQFGAGAARLGTVGSNRYSYWKVALKEFGREPLHGIGSGSFRVVWNRERTFAENVRDAHSIEFETAAELGIVGLLLLGLMLGGAGAGRAHGVAAQPRLRRRPHRRDDGVARALRDRLGLGDAGRHAARAAVRRDAARLRRRGRRAAAQLGSAGGGTPPDAGAQLLPVLPDPRDPDRREHHEGRLERVPEARGPPPRRARERHEHRGREQDPERLPAAVEQEDAEHAERQQQVVGRGAGLRGANRPALLVEHGPPRLPEVPGAQHPDERDEWQPADVVRRIVDAVLAPDRRLLGLVALGPFRDARDVPHPDVVPVVDVAAVRTGDDRRVVRRQQHELVERDRVADPHGATTSPNATTAAPNSSTRRVHERDARHASGATSNGISTSASARVRAARPSSTPSSAARCQPGWSANP